MSNHPAYRLKKHRHLIDIQTVTWYTEIIVLRAARHSEPVHCPPTLPTRRKKKTPFEKLVDSEERYIMKHFAINCALSLVLGLGLTLVPLWLFVYLPLVVRNP